MLQSWVRLVRPFLVAKVLFDTGCALDAGVPDQSWDESAPAGTGFGQDAPAAPAADEWGAAPAAGAAGWQLICLVQLCVPNALVMLHHISMTRLFWLWHCTFAACTNASTSKC